MVVTSKTTLSMEVDGARLVTTSGCDFIPAVFVKDSRIEAQTCDFRSYDNGSGPSTPGLSLYRSVAQLARCKVRGSSNPSPTPALMGLRADQSTVVLRGDGASTYVGGISGTWQAPGLQGTATSDLYLDPAIGIQGGIVGFRNVQAGRLPCLTIQGGQLGGTMTAELYAPAGDGFVVLVGLPGDPVPLPPFGELLVDPGSLFPVAAGSLGSTEHVFVRMPVPPWPVLRGLAVSCQTLSGPGTMLCLGNHAVTVLR
ncbi:MAG: hypothetical protein R3F30_04750 [Planctomycetota bacterium]